MDDHVIDDGWMTYGRMIIDWWMIRYYHTGFNDEQILRLVDYGIMRHDGMD